MKPRIRSHGIIIFLAVVFIAVFPKTFLRAHHSAGLASVLIPALGLSLMLSGQLLRVISRGYKAENSGEGRRLIRGGPYSMARNPMYLGIFLIGSGVVCLLFNFPAFMAFLVFFINRYFRLMLSEEKRLSAVFAQEYSDYIKEVPRFFPSFSFVFRGGGTRFLPLKYGWFRREISGIILVIVLGIGFESFLFIRSLGFAAFLPELAAFLAVILFYAFLTAFLVKVYAKNPAKGESI